VQNIGDEILSVACFFTLGHGDNKINKSISNRT